jgi:hypothetical protein
VTHSTHATTSESCHAWPDPTACPTRQVRARYLWWGRYLTQFQMLQFLANLVQARRLSPSCVRHRSPLTLADPLSPGAGGVLLAVLPLPHLPVQAAVLVHDLPPLPVWVLLLQQTCGAQEGRRWQEAPVSRIDSIVFPERRHIASSLPAACLARAGCQCCRRSVQRPRPADQLRRLAGEALLRQRLLHDVAPSDGPPLHPSRHSTQRRSRDWEEREVAALRTPLRG